MQLRNIISELENKYKGKGYRDEDFLFCRDFYRNEISYQRGKEVYDLIWQPIAEKLSPTDSGQRKTRSIPHSTTNITRKISERSV